MDRTPDQIQNLRIALLPIIGPFMLVVPDKYVNEIADSMQKDIDNAYNSRKREWVVKIRFSSEQKWESIEPEPKNPICSKNVITDICWALLIKYPKIFEIQVFQKDMFPDEKPLLFSRER